MLIHSQSTLSRVKCSISPDCPSVNGLEWTMNGREFMESSSLRSFRFFAGDARKMRQRQSAFYSPWHYWEAYPKETAFGTYSQAFHKNNRLECILILSYLSMCSLVSLPVHDAHQSPDGDFPALSSVLLFWILPSVQAVCEHACSPCSNSRMVRFNQLLSAASNSSSVPHS
jgi:hypothetical protein